MCADNHQLQLTPNNSNLQGKLKKVQAIRSLQQIPASKEMGLGGGGGGGGGCKYHRHSTALNIVFELYCKGKEYMVVLK